MSDTRLLVIGDLTIDLGARLLARMGVPLRLSPKAFTLLAALIGARPRALSKAELQELIWPGTFVVEANLANLVSEVRRALEDDPAQPRLLRTVYGYGYAWHGQFATPALPSGEEPAYWLYVGRTPFVLTPGEYILGRGPESIVPLRHKLVSRRHARLVLDAGRAVLTDLDSLNGTFVCGRRLMQPATLADFDEIRIGPYYLTLALPCPDAPTTRPGPELAPVPADT